MNPLALFLFKCFIYPLALVYNVGFAVFLLFYALLHPCQKFWKIRERDEPPKCLMDPSWGQHKFIQLNDVKLHYVENGNKDKPVMIFVHGFPEFWYSWRYQLTEFSKDYWVIALDLRGYGESDRPTKMSSYTMIKVIEDIRQLIESLGREKVIMVGHDWGGLIVWNFMDFHADMIDRFVIMNCPHHRTWVTMMAKNILQFFNSWYCFFFQLPYLPEVGMTMSDFRVFDKIKNKKNKDSGISDEDLDVFKYIFSKKGAMTCAINYYRANCGQLYLQDKSPDLYPEGLLLFGDQDGYLSNGFVGMAKKLIPNLSTCFVKGANHFVQQDKPVETNRAIRNFFNGKLEQTV